jgi:hypothetical protein
MSWLIAARFCALVAPRPHCYPPTSIALHPRPGPAVPRSGRLTLEVFARRSMRELFRRFFEHIMLQACPGAGLVVCSLGLVGACVGHDVLSWLSHCPWHPPLKLTWPAGGVLLHAADTGRAHGAHQRRLADAAPPADQQASAGLTSTSSGARAGGGGCIQDRHATAALRAWNRPWPMLQSHPPTRWLCACSGYQLVEGLAIFLGALLFLVFGAGGFVIRSAHPHCSLSLSC